MLLDCFGVRFVSPFSKKSQTLKTAKKPGKLDKHGHNFVIFSQATGQTWNHTSAYHLSTLEQVKTGSQQSQGVINESKLHCNESQGIKNELQGVTTCQNRVMTSRNESELDKSV